MDLRTEPFQGLGKFACGNTGGQWGAPGWNLCSHGNLYQTVFLSQTLHRETWDSLL